MLVKSYVDLQTSSGPMRTFIYQPNVPDYPEAKFPGVAVFTRTFRPLLPCLGTCQGYIVACNESYHEFEPLGSSLAELAAYDKDATVVIDHRMSCSDRTGRIGATGMYLGGHLAFHDSPYLFLSPSSSSIIYDTFDPRVLASVCYFATNIHLETLGKGTSSNTLARVPEIQCEVVMIFGKQDNHLPRAGRDLIRKTLEDAAVTTTFLEVQAQHAKEGLRTSFATARPPPTSTVSRTLAKRRK
ncbi:MAG: dienelactone hydrolase family protein [Benniella sp.]|nr:MAG: dienelactone hydrolase family protein [Benniella sp.]